MSQTNTELAESLHQFVTIWKMLGRPFPQVDQMDQPGLAISWPNTEFPFCNALFLTEQLTDAQVLQERVQAAAGYMRARPSGGLDGPLTGERALALARARVWICWLRRRQGSIDRNGNHQRKPSVFVSGGDDARSTV